MIPDKHWGSAAAEEFTGVKARQRWLCAECVRENPTNLEPPEVLLMWKGTVVCKGHIHNML